VRTCQGLHRAGTAKRADRSGGRFFTEHQYRHSRPTWGRLLFDAKDYLDSAPHWALFPGTMIFLVVLSINYVGDGLRDALDARKVL